MPQTLFWVAFVLAFAQVAHAFDACAAHFGGAHQSTKIAGAPCPVEHSCDNCEVVPDKDICESVSEFALRATAIAPLISAPVIHVDAPFVAIPVALIEERAAFTFGRACRDIPPLRSQYLAPQLSGRAPPFSV